MRVALKAAQDWGVPPLTLWGVSDTPGSWTDNDRKLALAYTSYTAGLCPCGCGFPASLAQNEDMDGWFEADDTRTCYARAALERYQEEHKKIQLEPGTLLGVKNTRE